MTKIQLKSLFILFFLLIGTFVFGQEVKPQLSAELNFDKAKTGGSIIVNFKIPKGYKQSTSRDYLYFKVINAPKLGLTDLEYPSLSAEEKESGYYKGDFSLKQNFTMADPSFLPQEGLILEVSWQLCEKSGLCLAPQKGQLPLKGKSKSGEISATENRPGFKAEFLLAPDQKSGEIVIQYSFAKGLKQSTSRDYLYFKVLNAPQLNFMSLEYPQLSPKEKESGYFAADFSLKQKFSLNGENSLPKEGLQIEVSWQLCEASGLCLAPQKSIFRLDYQGNLSDDLAVQEKASILAELDFNEIKKNSSRKDDIKITLPLAGANTAEDQEKSAALPLYLLYFLFAFVGGLILNIMPCVLPVLSLKAFHLVSQAGDDKKKILRSSLSYTGGIVFSFLVMASIVSIIKISGESIGWGFQFQNPWFVMILTAVVFVFSLAMFDVFIIMNPAQQKMSQAGSSKGYFGSFLAGVFAVLLATPCTAPFLGAALGFAFSQPPLVIFISFILIGLGLAFPFILLGFFPDIIKRLPKPGNWMNTFKEVMGFLLIATVIYLLYTVNALLGSQALLLTLIWLLVLAFCAWLYGKLAKPGTRQIRQLLSLLLVILLAGISFILINPIARGEKEGPATVVKGDWEEFSAEKAGKYRAMGYPVFVNFSAQWCATCQTNLATVLSTETLMKAFKRYNVKLLYADYTRQSPELTDWLKAYGRAGVPLYLLYVPKDDRTLVLPELLTVPLVLESLEKELNPVY